MPLSCEKEFRVQGLAKLREGLGLLGLSAKSQKYSPRNPSYTHSQDIVVQHTGNIQYERAEEVFNIYGEVSQSGEKAEAKRKGGSNQHAATLDTASTL